MNLQQEMYCEILTQNMESVGQSLRDVSVCFKKLHIINNLL